MNLLYNLPAMKLFNKQWEGTLVITDNKIVLKTKEGKEKTITPADALEILSYEITFRKHTLIAYLQRTEDHLKIKQITWIYYHSFTSITQLINKIENYV